MKHTMISHLENTALPGGYFLREIIGCGGMADVYRAEHPQLDRSVAVKILHPHLVHEANAGRRFANEAEMTRRIRHPHCVSVLDFGKTPGGQPFMVMAYARGRDLAQVMHDEGPLDVHRIINILTQVLDALREAHRNRIVHRDIKPGNVLVSRGPGGSDFIRILDFGLAIELPHDSSARANSSATVYGTPDFMSPEQCHGKSLDFRSDLYSVGAMLYLLLTERLPFQAASANLVLQMHVSERVKDPREVAPTRGIPGSLADIASKALAKRPADRFQNAQAFIESLRPLSKRY